MRGWQSKAPCAGAPDALFFPATVAHKHEELAQIANDQYCGTCPVKADCLTSAIKDGDSGIRAGTTYETRNKLRRARTRTKCPACKNKSLASVSEFSLCLACGASWQGERT